MKITEVPEQFKVYELVLSNGSRHKITGAQKLNIMKSAGNYVELSTGDVINKAFIVEIKLNFQETRDEVQANKNLISASEQFKKYLT